MYHERKTLRIVGYLRKSTDDSRHQKASIGDQRTWFDEYVATLRSRGDDVEIVQIFEERMSAKSPGRPEFAKMMGLFYAAKADTLITWDIDRLSRNEVDEGTIKWALRQGKIREVHTHNSVFTEHELLTMGIFLSLGAEELAKLRQRVLRGMNSMIKKGNVPHKAPYGYKNHESSVIPDDSEVEHLKSIFALRKDGYSYKQIAEWLNEQGIHTRSGAKWRTSAIDRIISNEFYMGVVKFAGQVGQGIFERIVTRDMWESVNVEKRANIGWRKHGFALKGIIVSSVTWKPLKASLIKKKYVYYHDDTHGISISEKEIFRKIEEIVDLWKMSETFFPDMEKGVKQYILEQNGSISAEREKSQKKLQEVKGKKSRVLNLYMDGKIEEDIYTEKIRELAMQERKYMDELDCFVGFDESLSEEYDELVKLFKDIPWYYRQGCETVRGEILKSTLVKLEIDEEKGLVLHEKEPFVWLSSSKNCVGIPNRNRTCA